MVAVGYGHFSFLGMWLTIKVGDASLSVVLCAELMVPGMNFCWLGIQIGVHCFPHDTICNSHCGVITLCSNTAYTVTRHSASSCVTWVHLPFSQNIFLISNLILSFHILLCLPGSHYPDFILKFSVPFVIQNLYTVQFLKPF